MACNESDEKLEILNEIRTLEEKVTNLGNKEYELAIQRKMLRHRIADLRYRLREIDHNI